MDWVDILRALGALLVTVGIMLTAYWGLQRARPHLMRLQGHAAPKPLRVVQTLPVDAKRKLCVVRHRDREHLVLTGPTGDTLLESSDAPEELAESADVLPMPLFAKTESSKTKGPKTSGLDA